MGYKQLDMLLRGPLRFAATSPELDSAVFKAAPHRTYRGHKQDVLDIAWSKSQFLLTASMDKSVRLWHVSMNECLRVFR